MFEVFFFFQLNLEILNLFFVGAPSQPTNLTVFNITSNQVILKWNPSKDDGGRKDLEYK